MTQSNPSTRGDPRMFIRNLMAADVAIFCVKKGIHGWSWAVDLELEGELDELGFISDFSKVKAKAKDLIKQILDHRLIVPAKNPAVTVEQIGKTVSFQGLTAGLDGYQYICPDSALFALDADEVTVETLEAYLEAELLAILPKNIKAVQVRLRDEDLPETDLSFLYTHGLPKHDGLCQRIFHGHRSRLEVRTGGARNGNLERYLWEHFLLQGQVHVVSPDQIDQTSSESAPLRLAYAASMGEYVAELPKQRTLVIQGETSIETLTQAAFDFLRASDLSEAQAADLVVILCEGIDKGAIATAKKR